MGNSNVIPYEQYLSVNDISDVPSCASSALNSVCVSPVNDAFVPHDPIATELKIYKEHVAIYEQRAKFELTEHEQRMDDQMSMLIQNRNKTEENLKKELHSFKLQLKSTMENNKIIGETECFVTKDVFYTATDSVLNVSRFSDMHDAFTSAQKQRFGNKKPVTSSDAPSFDSLFVIGKLNEQIQSRGNTIRELKEKISCLTKKNSDTDPIFDLKALVSQNKDLTAKLNALQDLNECLFRINLKRTPNVSLYLIVNLRCWLLGRISLELNQFPLDSSKNREVCILPKSNALRKM
ncbi:hypothetical protein Tco_0764569 [Tanacetum coccineum]